MRKVLVFQHVANEILGTLNPALKQQGLNIRYVNFEREPDANPSVEKYNGLIVLGGYMGVYEADQYTHIKTEMKLIEQALKKNIPVLGICLGAQILAHVLGSEVRKSAEKEMGWYDIELTTAGENSSLLSHFKKTEKVFQMHGDTFDIPKSCEHLAHSKICPAQAFSYGPKAFGLQFHLEVDEAMISRWLNNPKNQKDIIDSQGKVSAEQMQADTNLYLKNSMNLSQQTFKKFVELFAIKERPILLKSK
ncbi:GMP synthase [Bdellovibrio sp. qaytius]|nr:GMP synthase [Bdellovibrio sp. qaytius]